MPIMLKFLYIINSSTNLSSKEQVGKFLDEKIHGAVIATPSGFNTSIILCFWNRLLKFLQPLKIQAS